MKRMFIECALKAFVCLKLSFFVVCIDFVFLLFWSCEFCIVSYEMCKNNEELYQILYIYSTRDTKTICWFSLNNSETNAPFDMKYLWNHLQQLFEGWKCNQILTALHLSIAKSSGLSKYLQIPTPYRLPINSSSSSAWLAAHFEIYRLEHVCELWSRPVEVN